MNRSSVFDVVLGCKWNSMKPILMSSWRDSLMTDSPSQTVVDLKLMVCGQIYYVFQNMKKFSKYLQRQFRTDFDGHNLQIKFQAARISDDSPFMLWWSFQVKIFVCKRNNFNILPLLIANNMNNLFRFQIKVKKKSFHKLGETNETYFWNFYFLVRFSRISCNYYLITIHFYLKRDSI